MIFKPIMSEETITFPMPHGPRASFSKLCLVIPNEALGLKGTQPVQMYKVGFVPVQLETKAINQLQIEGYCMIPFQQDAQGWYWVLPLKRQLFDKVPFYEHPADILAEIESLFPGIARMMHKARINWKAQIANVLCGAVKPGFHYCYHIVLCNSSWDILSGTQFTTRNKVFANPLRDDIEWTNPLIAAAKIDNALPMNRTWSWFSDDVSTVTAAEALAKALSKLHPDLCVAFGRNVPEAYPGIPKSKLYVRYFIGGKAYKEIPEILKDITK